MTVSLEKLTDPADSVTAAALRLEIQRVTDALELAQADLTRTQGALGSLEARYSNIHGALQREQGEARAAREKFGELRANARDLLREIVTEYDLDDYRSEISDKGENIGLDPLDYSYKGTVTVSFDIEGLRKDDGSEFTEDDVRAWLEATLRASGEFNLDYESSVIEEIELEQE
ncbi:hypothetical protein NX794_07715 [Streptomyces sp. LP11]|uniref:Uncharacterized protein n=1 Tax=Streptomyces pyxinicus TaxID=2970331 RepID=A0ABT2AXY4_9ACTN|nr:hypothetical protein [Streptomyces sp. LP11]MCS0601117.1 hypothetical protein [Streptomyces sp. LP11]